ncbi:MAG: hypothetical protein DSY58_06000 [Desulfobulbus sp.]|nr:MAG: hypothetical protein DSY58_06000 [Desulfobulbus sp.]
MKSLTINRLLEWLGLLSVVTFFASIVFIPWLILRLETDFFIKHRVAPPRASSHALPVRVILLVLRNGVGLVFLAAGVAMLFLPGQGILTILIGLSMMNFPGREFVLERLVQNQKVRKSLNWLRSKGNKAPFRFTGKNQDDLT